MAGFQREIVLTGIGGQGIQLCAKSLAMAAVAEGRQAMLSASWGGEMRGGKTEASVVLATDEVRALPILPSTWGAFVMHEAHWDAVRDRVRPGGVVAVNASLVTGDLGAPDATVLAVPAGGIADELGAPMGAAFVLLGAFAAATAVVATDSLVGAMQELVPPYRTQHLAANEACLRAGADAAPTRTTPAWAEEPAPSVGP